ncbi:MAG: putative DNA modification/repair radical SAM protein [bacterium]|nr:putative DNA modification/repair radical SAM protein [bacterium]
MDITEKLQILSMAAKYDASCASSGSSRPNRPGGTGHSVDSGICHSWSDDGRCQSLLKVLLTNNCIYDCAYCINRQTNDIPRASFTPDEVADLMINFYKRNYIEGLFLSSAIFRSPDYTMELMIKAIEKIRVSYRFNGYIHIKAIPGADPALIRRAGLLVDRLSANIELPSQKSLNLLAPQKTKTAILSTMNQVNTGIVEYQWEQKRSKHIPRYVPAGQSTQLIVGATPESDRTIMRLSEALYDRLSMKRVYYSAYIPIPGEDSRLPVVTPPLKREHRLYQADWLLRFYGFTAEELLDEDRPNLDIDIDPKSTWALRHLDQFPVEINRADIETILRVPGIGVRSAHKIIKARRAKTLNFDDLKKIGIVLKRARYFVTCNGKHMEKKDLDELAIKLRLLDTGKETKKKKNLIAEIDAGQLFLFGSETSSKPASNTENNENHFLALPYTPSWRDEIYPSGKGGTDADAPGESRTDYRQGWRKDISHPSTGAPI